jgi:hypothetical protein
MMNGNRKAKYLRISAPTPLCPPTNMGSSGNENQAFNPEEEDN